VAALAAPTPAQAVPIACTVHALRAAIDAADSDPDETLVELPAPCTYTISGLNPLWIGDLDRVQGG
jgi:hypothetical protein